MINEELTSASDRHPLPDYQVEADGWLDQARRCASPNFGPRPHGPDDISLLVVHNISLPPGRFGSDAIERFFCNSLDASEDPFYEQIKDLRVSAHMLIRRDGELVQFVSFDERAWHAGRSEYDGRQECNDFGIGIEMEGADDVAYTEPQYRQLAAVTRALIAHYPRMSETRIAGHCDIAPGRKTDPGPAFNWQHYYALLGQSSVCEGRQS